MGGILNQPSSVQEDGPMGCKLLSVGNNSSVVTDVAGTVTSFVPDKRSLQPEGLLPSRGIAGSGFRPLPNIPHCCLP